MFKQYGASVVANAHTFCERFKELGATIVSGGTDNHLFLIDV